MKQYLSSEQTAKLIELGLPKPKSIIDAWAHETDIDVEYEYETAYSIGELIEMLPKRIDDIYPLYITLLNEEWKVYYGLVDDFKWWSTPFDTAIEDELIDALYEMILQLKEEGVI